MKGQLSLLVLLATALAIIGGVSSASTMITTSQDGSINCDGLKCPPGSGVRCEVSSHTLNGQSTVERKCVDAAGVVLAQSSYNVQSPGLAFVSVLLVGAVAAVAEAVAEARPELERPPEQGLSAGASLQRLDFTAAARTTVVTVTPAGPEPDGHLATSTPASTGLVTDLGDGLQVTEQPLPLPTLSPPVDVNSTLVTGMPTTTVPGQADGRPVTGLPAPDASAHAHALIPALLPVSNALDAPATSTPWPAPTSAIPEARVPPAPAAPQWDRVLVEPTATRPTARPAPASRPAVSQLPVVLPGPGPGPGPGHAHPGNLHGHRLGYHPPCRPGLHRPARCEASVRWDGVSTRVVCSGGLHKISRTRSHKTTVLVLCYWPDDAFDPSMLTVFGQLERLRVTDSNITELLDFPYHDHLQELVLAGLRLTWIGDDVFTALRRLRLLDLSRNQLSSLDSACVLRLPGLQQLLLAGNPWRCTLALSWLSEPRARRLVADPDGMQCGAALYPRRPVLPVVALLKRVADECPASDPCSCELTSVVRKAGEASRDAPARDGGPGVVVGDLLPIITVNCSHRGLVAMPARLPANTTTLLLRGNKVTSVRPLVERHAGVLDVYLDNNHVESIADLEGSPWLANFRVLSLRANKLEQLPTYALDNALERNDHVVRVYLGLNPWRCDCQFTPTFQELLAKYKPLIQDWDDIRCAAVEGDENSMKKIHALSRGAVCREEAEPRVSALDLLIAALAVSLVTVLAKLAFDFWRYRRYGTLPWIATKLP
ncbi:Protein singed wings 2 [Frankliniella fusca]|uniref:Protein singed wings 2 n=1 Tax=Frankliniella fusca TaxID=407009 RepID=A0AAE1I1U7_9NEOP|nr:Protein singed wings 2 [Frankliniella fusca]